RIKALAADLLIAREMVGEEPKVSTPLFRAWLVKTEAVSVPEDVNMLPEAFQRRRVTVEADKAAIKAAIKAGESVPGAFLVESRGIRWT
ncbi:siphovirus Gp157 family protein, partial [Janthinobacterium sp.]|uniref:siphovirus Gp157 family protein n=1 Tax=Janthinobacterium sp. TaxID=1871054 RepID=UPI0025BF32EB